MHMGTDAKLEAQLAALFEEAGNAHHQAFTESGGDDPEWPLWYADYLHEKLSKALGAGFTRSELVYLLVMVAKEQALRAPGANWARYYARFFATRYT
ncbi:MAG: hypothetical protein Kow00120_21510 [Anaerolineae bacterium]